jgi:hypothetical protein
VRSGALIHGQEARGAAGLKPGFSFSEQQDLAFALGWPSLRFVADGLPDDDDPVASLRKWSSYSHVCVPAKVAACSVRDQADYFAAIAGRPAAWLPRAREPIDRDEARALVAECVDKHMAVGSLFRLEALTTPDDVLSDICAALADKLPQGDPEWSRLAAPAVHHAAAVMLRRLPEPPAQSVRANLAALAQIGAAAGNHENMARAFDVALDRGTASREIRWLIHGNGAPGEVAAWVERMEIDEGTYPDARAAFLGGEPVIEIMRKRWREFKKDAREDLVEEYGWIRSEQTVLLMVDLVTSNVKGLVKKWFIERGEYARPFLVDLEKQTGPTALQARGALEIVDAALGRAAKGKAAKKKA